MDSFSLLLESKSFVLMEEQNPFSVTAAGCTDHSPTLTTEMNVPFATWIVTLPLLQTNILGKKVIQHLRSQSKPYKLCLPGPHFQPSELTKLSKSNRTTGCIWGVLAFRLFVLLQQTWPGFLFGPCFPRSSLKHSMSYVHMPWITRSKLWIWDKTYRCKLLKKWTNAAADRGISRIDNAANLIHF